MNKTAIKNYATWARKELMERVAQKAYEYGISKDKELPKIDSVSINGRLLLEDEKKQLNELIFEVKKNGFNHVIEEVAYTWFNRFIALRYMEVNNYLPLKIRVFTNENNEFKPQILTEAIHIDLEELDKNQIASFIDDNNQEGLYKYLLLAICNDMNKYLPEMFTSISDYKTLLFPDNLLREDSVLSRLVRDIDEQDWTDQVQIIGWLYQYYNSELKDEVMKKKDYSKDDIPAATQLFTPDWIVRYMVENSLGRLWIDGHPDFNHDNWKYYLEDAEQTPEVLKKLDEIKEEHSHLKPEDIKVLEPCMGSGHILVYAFDVLMDIYRDCGYQEKDAVISILQNNLYGLEIDERAYHLAYFSIMMKARSYSRTILSQNIKTNLCEIVDTPKMPSKEALLKLGEYKEKGEYLLDLFKNAKEFGSILNVELTLEEIDELDNQLNNIDRMMDYGNLMDQSLSLEIMDCLDPLLKQARILAQQYDVVITNPPYMAPSSIQKPYVQKYYPDSKSDLFAVFIEKCHSLTKKNAYQAMITMHSWMFLASFEKLRYKLKNINIVNMLHLGARAFDEIGGEVVQTTAFVFENSKLADFQGIFFRLLEGNNEERKRELFINKQNKYISSQNRYNIMPGNPIVYWISSKLISAFQDGRPLSPVASPCVGLQTGDNGRFLRLWFEVCNYRISFDSKSCEDSLRAGARWFPYNKGGEFRKWYGNNDYVVNWENDGNEIRNFKDENGKLRSRPQNTDFYFHKSASWSKISSGSIAFRFKPIGHIFDVAGTSIFANDDNLLIYVLAYCNSKVALSILRALSPTLNYEVGQIASLPLIDSNEKKDIIVNLTNDCINLSKTDWDSFETSWDFKIHPLVKNKVATIKEAYELWDKECDDRFNKLKSNEEELNRIFIDIYGLQDELTPEVEDKDVTVRKAELTRDIKSLISYAVGCMFGRYSLDIEGLAYAGGEFNNDKYKTYTPDKDNILPICDEEYFDDDIVSRFVKFIEVTYGKDTLEDNLSFIASALGGKGNSRDVLRNYFLNDFFKDHCNTYQVTGSGKRPIYWLFDSGKNNGFKALMYIHRYTPDLIARLRTDYIHPLQSRYRTQIELLENQISNSSTTNEKVKLNKQLNKIKDQAKELSIYEEKVHHYADMMIPMDLDNGVKANYTKFEELLGKIK